MKLTICSAADFLEIHPNTAAFFYKKICQVIVHHLQNESAEMFNGIHKSSFPLLLKGSNFMAHQTSNLKPYVFGVKFKILIEYSSHNK